MTKTDIEFTYIPHLRDFSKAESLVRGAFGLGWQKGKDLVKAARLARDRGDPFRIRCTDRQFTRFLIDRNAMGIPNGFKELNAEYITPSPRSLLIDVRGAREGKCSCEA